MSPRAHSTSCAMVIGSLSRGCSEVVCICCVALYNAHTYIYTRTVKEGPEHYRNTVHNKFTITERADDVQRDIGRTTSSKCWLFVIARY
jgi:hypothetical protein